MPIEAGELRQGERFNFTDPHDATFTGIEVSILNIGLGGVQICHPQLLRLGTHGPLHFRHDDGVVTVTGRVLWSHLAQTDSGMLYRSGIAIDAPDQQFASAINTFFRMGVIHRDHESLERKRAQMQEREERRRSQPRLAPVSIPATDPTATS